MFKSIRTKFFLTFLLTTLLVVTGMYFFMRWSLDRGFNEYIESRQNERVQLLIEKLTDYYANEQTWDKLEGNKSKWLQLLLQSNNSHHNHLKPRLSKFLQSPSNLWPPDISNTHRKRRFIPFEFRAMLLKKDKSFIFGRKGSLPNLKLYPILYQQETVGFLGLTPGKPINQPSELRFMEKQSQSLFWIAISMVVLSGILALFLAFIFGRSLKKITEATKNLAKGRYETRLTIESNDEIGQLARDFNDLAAALENSENSRRRWIADISHELRTPLAVLRGELEAIQDGIRPLTNQSIDSLYTDVIQLNRLTDDLYQLALSDQGALSYRKQNINPVKIINDDFEALKFEFDRKNIQVKFVDSPVNILKIYADPDRISQLFRNILNNCCKYTDEGGQLTIKIERKKNMLTFDFSDSGPGVSEEQLIHIFDRFYRVENSRNRNHGGAGLGLAICKNIVAAHNGKISAKHSQLGGLAIVVELPMMT